LGFFSYKKRETIKMKYSVFKENCRWKDRCYCEYRNSHDWNRECDYLDMCKKSFCPVVNKKGENNE